MNASAGSLRFIGFPDSAAQLDRALGDVRVVERGLPGMRRYENVLFVPRAGREGGLFEADGTPIQAAFHVHGPHVFLGDRRPDPLPGPARVVDEDLLYLGLFFDHFGHLLVEGLARTWALRAPDAPRRALFHDLSRFPGRAYQRTIFAGLGLTPERLLCADEPLLLRSVLVPEPALIYARSLHRELRATYHGVLEQLGLSEVQESEQPLYLSRSGLPRSARRALDEPALERVLEQHGFRVFRPELHDLRTQLAVVHRHRHVFGFWGSALRLTYFSPRPKRTFYLHDGFPWPSVLMDPLFTGADACFVRAVEDESLVVAPGGWRVAQSLRSDALFELLRGEGYLPGASRPRIQSPRAEELLRESAYIRAHELVTSNDGASFDRLCRELASEPRLLSTAWLGAAEAERARGAASARARAARRAVELDPTSAPAHSELSAVLSRAHFRSEARHHARAALRLEPANARAALSMAELSGGDAEAPLRRALEAAPHRLDLRRALARRLDRSGRADDAYAVLKAGLPLGRDAVEVWRALGRRFARQGRRGRAAVALRRALALDPFHLELRMDAAALWLELGRFEGALVHAELATRIMPQHGRAQELHAVALGALGRREDGRWALAIARGLAKRPLIWSVKRRLRGARRWLRLRVARAARRAGARVRCGPFRRR